MNETSTLWSGRRGTSIAVALLLAIAMLSSCSDDKPIAVQPSDSFTGVWEGTINSSRLRLELLEDPPGLITGRVILEQAHATDTLTIGNGKRPEPDSLYLDVSGPIRPPLGCGELFSGRRDRADHLVGDHYYRCGHDPPTVTAWSVNRQPN